MEILGQVSEYLFSLVGILFGIYLVRQQAKADPGFSFVGLSAGQLTTIGLIGVAAIICLIVFTLL